MKKGLTLNERIATRITRLTATMWTAYFFALLSLVSLPAAIESHDALVIVSWVAQTFLQLVLLPIIMVGQDIQTKHHEDHAQKLDAIIDHHGITVESSK